jgi:hypothetical protein
VYAIIVWKCPCVYVMIRSMKRPIATPRDKT